MTSIRFDCWKCDISCPVRVLFPIKIVSVIHFSLLLLFLFCIFIIIVDVIVVRQRLSNIYLGGRLDVLKQIELNVDVCVNTFQFELYSTDHFSSHSYRLPIRVSSSWFNQKKNKIPFFVLSFSRSPSVFLSLLLVLLSTLLSLSRIFLSLSSPLSLSFSLSKDSDLFFFSSIVHFTSRNLFTFMEKDFFSASYSITLDICVWERNPIQPDRSFGIERIQIVKCLQSSQEQMSASHTVPMISFLFFRSKFNFTAPQKHEKNARNLPTKIAQNIELNRETIKEK